ncbi:uncharacterized protein LOC62_04G005300 [Vanrija pseudolonga]|uniref:Uncharacterized protein n=1 Tax=Vanrija pseudolonga TaxID=143232 RepID=A0AAF1BM86_9TREE|nr:hypothetical protein LOC62_04G005300 [Vanrija pseudolonga]
MSLDHTSYPAIIDTILAHSGVQVLVRFRSTSSHFRATVDAYFARLHYAEIRDDGEAYTLLSPSRQPLPWIPSAVRVLTTPFLPTPNTHWAVFSPFTGLHTLRRVDAGVQIHGAYFPSVSTVVDYHPIDGAVDAIHIPPKTRRYVHHHRLDGGRDAAWTGTDLEGLKGVQEAVFVYHPSAVTVSVLDKLNCFLNLCVCYEQVLRTGGTLTIVGVESLLHPDPVPDDGLFGLMGVLQPGMWSALPQFNNRTRTITMSKWLDELGEARAAVEGRWAGWDVST